MTAWREAYAAQLPADFLAALDTDARADSWAALIASGRTAVWVAEVAGAIVGWATAGPGRDENAPVPLELQGVYVLESAYGSGTGQALLEAAVGDDRAYLWVMAENPRAQAFYRRNGFLADAAAKVERVGGVEVEVVRMVRH